jgi:hypothetical protein
MEAISKQQSAFSPAILLKFPNAQGCNKEPSKILSVQSKRVFAKKQKGGSLSLPPWRMLRA